MAKKPDDLTDSRSHNSKAGGRGKKPHESQPQASAAHRVTSIDSSISEPSLVQWRHLATLTISIETFCEEVTHMVDRWPYDERIDRKKRGKAAADVQRLVTNGKNARDRLLAFVANVEERPHESMARQTEAVWRRLQAIGLGAKLQYLLDTLGRIADRLREQYSSDAVAKINEDFRSLSRKISSVNSTATTVRGSLQQRVAGLLSTEVASRLKDLIQAITKAVTGSTGKVLDTFPEHASFADRLPKQLECIKEVNKAYAALRLRLHEECEEKRKSLFGRDEAEAMRFYNFLESIDQVLFMARSTEEYAFSIDDAAAKGIDEGISMKAEELKEAIATMRLEEKLLDDTIWRYRDIVSRAPFKRVQPKKPMPPWANLTQKEREALTILARRRAADPDGEMYSMSRRDIEVELGLPENDPTLNRLLISFDEGHAIVGKYQPIRSIAEQRPAYAYWIEEYAFSYYGPDALGDASVPPAGT